MKLVTSWVGASYIGEVGVRPPIVDLGPVEWERFSQSEDHGCIGKVKVKPTSFNLVMAKLNWSYAVEEGKEILYRNHLNRIRATEKGHLLHSSGAHRGNWDPSQKIALVGWWCKWCLFCLVGLGTNGVMIWDHTVVISLCSTNGSEHAGPPTNYRWEFQTSNSVFLPAPFFIFLSPVFHISSLAQEPDIEFVGRSAQ